MPRAAGFTASDHPLRISQLERLLFRLPAEFGGWPAVQAKLERLNYRAALVGPHGSGKTTCLLELARRQRQSGRRVEVLFTNAESGAKIPAEWRETLADVDEDALVIADGYDVLSMRHRWLLRTRLRPRGGLLVTAHRRAALPTLMRTRVTPALLGELADALYAEHPDARPSDATLAQQLAQCHGNAREVFRRLYRGELGFGTRGSVFGKR